MAKLKTEDVQALDHLVHGEPAKALPQLIEYDQCFANSTLWKSVRGALFIDAGTALRDEDLVFKGVAHENAFLSVSPPDHLQTHLYNLGNGHSTLEDIARAKPGYKFNPDNSALLDAKRCFREALKLAGDSAGPQLLVNYANCLSAGGRTIEAIDLWRRALTLSPEHPMALGNLAIGTKYIARLTNDYVALPQVADGLRRALASPMENEMPDRAKTYFADELTKIDSFLKRNPRIKEPQIRPTTDNYELYCRQNDLFLSLSVRKVFDAVSLSLITHISDDSTFPRLARVINEIKERFALARMLSFEASNGSIGDLDADRLTTYADLSDGGVYGTRPAKLKLAFETAFNVLDKIAFFLNDYMKLNISDKDVSFLRVWGTGQAGLRPEILRSSSFQLFALYDLSRDLSKAGYLERFRSERHISTHRYLVPHTKPEKEWKTQADSVEYHTGYKLLLNDTLQLLRLVKGAIIYLIAFVNMNEHPDKKGVGMVTREIIPSHKPTDIRAGESKI
jgi:tetratricopeptide (TPR) repeat protein